MGGLLGNLGPLLGALAAHTEEAVRQAAFWTVGAVHALAAPAASAPAAAAATVDGPAGQLRSYLIVSGALFVLGVITVLTRRNLLYVLMGVELILNAANLNFVAFSRFGGYGIDGQMFVIVVVVLAAAEAAIALAIIMRVFHDFGSVDVTRTDTLRD